MIGESDVPERLGERQAPYPPGTLVASIARDGEIQFSHADTALGEGAIVTVVTRPRQAPQVRVLAEGRLQRQPADRKDSALAEVRDARKDRGAGDRAVSIVVVMP